MIKTRNLVILAAVLVVLTGINLAQKSSHEKKTSADATEVVLAGEFSDQTIGKVSLSYGNDGPQVVLKKGPTGWVLSNHFNARANDQRVGTLLRNFSNISGEFRSDSDQVLGDYGLQEDQCVTVRAFDDAGAQVFALLLGNTPEGSPGHFIRQPESSRVLVSQKNLLSHMGIYGEPAAPTARYFLELQAVKEDREQIDGFVITDGGKVLNLKKKFAANESADGALDRTTWEWLENGRAATDLAKTKVDGLLSSSVSIRATDVADPTVAASAYGLDSPPRTLLLQRQDGSGLLLKFGNSREASEGVTAGTYMRVDGQDEVWVVTDYSVKNIFKSRDDLKAE